MFSAQPIRIIDGFHKYENRSPCNDEQSPYFQRRVISNYDHSLPATKQRKTRTTSQECSNYGLKDERCPEENQSYKQRISFRSSCYQPFQKSSTEKKIKKITNQSQSKDKLQFRQNFLKSPRNHTKQTLKQRDLHQYGQKCELGEKIDQIVSMIKKLDKRVSILEDKRVYETKYQEEPSEIFQDLKDQLAKLQIQVKQCLKMDDYLKLSTKDHQSRKASSNKSNSTISDDNPTIKKQVDLMLHDMNEKYQQNFDHLNSMIHQLDQELKINLNLLNPNFKSSNIKCSNSAILLRFIELFKVRNHNVKKGQMKITITDNTYYVDSDGYLLDKDQYYLVNSLGNHIKLEERHIKRLRQEQVLQ